MFGREILTPVDIIYGCVPGECYKSPSEYAQILRKRMSKAYAQVREYSWTSTLRRKVKHDFDGKFPKFEVGDAVWYCYYPCRFSGLNQKWRLLWDGPFTIISKIGETYYKIKHVERKFTVLTNAHKLKKVLVWEKTLNESSNEETPPDSPEILLVLDTSPSCPSKKSSAEGQSAP